MQTVVEDVIVRRADIPEGVATLNRLAAKNAEACGVSFMAHPGFYDRCDIVCPFCEEGWIETLTSFYAKYPFGCMNCGPEESRKLWAARASHEMRTQTLEAATKSMVKKARKAVFTLDESERGPFFGRLKRIENKGATKDDFRWMRELMEPDAELVE